MLLSTEHMIRLPADQPLWDRVFTVAPLVLVGTREQSGLDNLAPKHMAMPLGWDNYFAFVCAPTHRTYQNIDRTGSFTVSYPRATQVVAAALTAAPRDDQGAKPGLPALPTFPAEFAEGCFIEDGYLYLECRLERIVDDFGPNSLIVGEVINAFAREEAVRAFDVEDENVVRQTQLMAYLSPGRFAAIDASYNFPFPAGYRR